MEGTLSEEEKEAAEEYGSPRETARDDVSSCDEADYRALLGSPLQHHLRAPQDGRSPSRTPYNALQFPACQRFLPQRQLSGMWRKPPESWVSSWYVTMALTRS